MAEQSPKVQNTNVRNLESTEYQEKYFSLSDFEGSESEETKNINEILLKTTTAILDPATKSWNFQTEMENKVSFVTFIRFFPM